MSDLDPIEPALKEALQRKMQGSKADPALRDRIALLLATNAPPVGDNSQSSQNPKTDSTSRLTNLRQPWRWGLGFLAVSLLLLLAFFGPTLNHAWRTRQYIAANQAYFDQIAQLASEPIPDYVGEPPESAKPTVTLDDPAWKIRGVREVPYKSGFIVVSKYSDGAQTIFVASTATSQIIEGDEIESYHREFNGIHMAGGNLGSVFVCIISNTSIAPATLQALHSKVVNHHQCGSTRVVP